MLCCILSGNHQQKGQSNRGAERNVIHACKGGGVSSPAGGVEALGFAGA